MKQIPRGSNFLLPKKGAFSTNSYAAAHSQKLNASNPKPPTNQPSIATPPPASTRTNAESPSKKESVSTSKYSSNKEPIAPITWGVDSKEDTYHTSYKNFYATHDKLNSTPKSRESYHHTTKMTSTLIPHELYQHRRSKQLGDLNPIHSKRVSTEGDSINDRIGELPQAVCKRGRAHVPEPKVKDPMLDNRYRYYKPAEISTTSREGSASRLIKQILDLSPPKSVTSGSTPRRCLESLAFTQELKDTQKSVVDTLGKGYSSVEKKVGMEVTKGKKQFLEKRDSVEDMKGVMAHSYLYKRDSLDATATSAEREVPGNTSNTKVSHRLENYYQSLSYRQHRPAQSLYTTSPRAAVQSPRESTIRSRETDFSGEKTMSSYQRRPSQEETTPQERLMLNNMALLGSGNGNSFVRDRRLSNSSRGSAAETPRKASIGRFDDGEKDRSLDKNSFVVVSHEKKKPIAGGSFGNPKLFGGSTQKSMPAAGVKTKREEGTKLW